LSGNARSSEDGEAPLAAVFGCGGATLSRGERAFFRAANPLGFILFARNCRSPDQAAELVAALRETVGRADAPVLIDQEGGRVQRLRPPGWPQDPPAGRFGRLAQRRPDLAEEAVRLQAAATAADLRALGVTANAVPVLDLQRPGASDVVGDRAFSGDPEVVARLGRAVCEAHLAAGVLPIVKHLPGHGRAPVDSHVALPTVDAPLDELDGTDFAPFRALADMPWGMVCHVVFAAIDPARPASLSPTAIGETVRGRIGFDGLLVSDDLCMGALHGDAGSRAAAALAAGCDVALHCNGRLSEMESVAERIGPLSHAARRRLERGEARRGTVAGAPAPGEAADLRARVDALLAAA
jgi:beta-N-acetylhexosaminidase